MLIDEPIGLHWFLIKFKAILKSSKSRFKRLIVRTLICLIGGLRDADWWTHRLALVCH